MGFGERNGAVARRVVIKKGICDADLNIELG
jgi:hypothetical protein